MSVWFKCKLPMNFEVLCNERLDCFLLINACLFFFMIFLITYKLSYVDKCKIWITSHVNMKMAAGRSSYCTFLCWLVLYNSDFHGFLFNYSTLKCTWWSVLLLIHAQIHSLSLCSLLIFTFLWTPVLFMPQGIWWASFVIRCIRNCILIC